MERLGIPIRFADLRRLAATVPAYLATKVGERRVPTLRARVEDTLSIVGLDTISLILEFAETYQVDLALFDFTDPISPEWNGPGCLLFLPAAAYLLLGWLLKTAVGLVCWLFARNVARSIWQYPVPRFWNKPDSQDNLLTFGDFVASAAAGHFVKREHVRFQLVR